MFGVIGGILFILFVLIPLNIKMYEADKKRKMLREQKQDLSFTKEQETEMFRALIYDNKTIRMTPEQVEVSMRRHTKGGKICQN